MKSVFSALACSLALAACGVAPAQAPVMNTQTVTVTAEVPVPCVDSIPASPEFQSDADLLSGTGSQVADKLWADHIEHKDYVADLLAVLMKCEKLPTQSAVLK